MNKTLIVTGGDISQKFLQQIISENKFENIIASDRGIEELYKSNIVPNYIIGDFDSANKSILNKYVNEDKIQVIKLNPEKDYTDTHMALKLAIKLKSTSVTIIGAIGSRVDHTISNVHILKEAMEKNIECEIVNGNNKIKLINSRIEIEKDEKYKYISLIPLTTKVTGINLKGLKYTLTEATLKIGHSIGISNEQINNKAIIELKRGILIIIQSKD